jgi:hypothetical protein
MPCSACSNNKNSTFKSNQTFIMGGKKVKRGTSTNIQAIKIQKIKTTTNQRQIISNSNLYLLGRRH